MATKTPESLFFTALGNEHRFRILNALLNKPMSVNELSSKLEIEQSNLSHDLKCLLGCRFVEFEVKGRVRLYRLSPETKKLISSTRNYINYYSRYLRRCRVLR